MSEDVYSAGIMVPITHNLTKEEIMDFGEWAYDTGETEYSLAYSGELMYSQNDSDQGQYGINFSCDRQHHRRPKIYTSESIGQMIKMQESADRYALTLTGDKWIKLDRELAEMYTCLWYNGSDSDMDMMTRSEFLKATGQ
jgi:hypothetical protein